METKEHTKYWLVTVKYIKNFYDYDLCITETITTRGSLVKFLNDTYQNNNPILLNSLKITEKEWRNHITTEQSVRIENN